MGHGDEKRVSRGYQVDLLCLKSFRVGVLQSEALKQPALLSQAYKPQAPKRPRKFLRLLT